MSDSGAWGDLPTFERPSSGSWLYQHAGNLYGPIPTDVLLDRIRKGKLPEDIVVCEDGRDEFIPISEHPALKDAAEKAFQAAKELKARQQKQKAANAKRTVIVIVSTVLVVVLGGGGYYGWRYMERQKAEQALKRKLEAEALALRLKQDEEKKKLADIAKAEDDIELGLDLLPLVSVKEAKKKTHKGGKKRPNEVDEGPQGCQLDPGTIATTFRGGFGQIKACLKEQQKRSDPLPDALTLSFTIANTGSVVSFETDDRNVRNGPFFDCLKKSVMGMHFPKFAGERCNIDYPISIGKKK